MLINTFNTKENLDDFYNVEKNYRSWKIILTK